MAAPPSTNVNKSGMQRPSARALHPRGCTCRAHRVSRRPARLSGAAGLHSCAARCWPCQRRRSTAPLSWCCSRIATKNKRLGTRPGHPKVPRTCAGFKCVFETVLPSLTFSARPRAVQRIGLIVDQASKQNSTVPLVDIACPRRQLAGLRACRWRTACA